MIDIGAPIETLKLMPLLCRMGWHSWSVWGDEKERKAGIFNFITRYQVSECVRCFARREREVEMISKL